MNPRVYTFLRSLPALAVLALAVGCATSVELQTLRDDETDFSRYRSWSWRPAAVEDERPRSETERELARRVHRGIRRDLAQKGFDYRSGNADLEIDARLAVTREQEVTHRTGAIESLSSLHDSASFEIQGTRREVVPYERGRLTIRVIDRRRNREVWRAEYEGRFRGEFTPHVERAIAHSLASLPEVPSEPPPFDPGAIAMEP